MAESEIWPVELSEKSGAPLEAPVVVAQPEVWPQTAPALADATRLKTSTEALAKETFLSSSVASTMPATSDDSAGLATSAYSERVKICLLLTRGGSFWSASSTVTVACETMVESFTCTTRTLSWMPAPLVVSKLKGTRLEVPFGPASEFGTEMTPVRLSTTRRPAEPSTLSEKETVLFSGSHSCTTPATKLASEAHVTVTPSLPTAAFSSSVTVEGCASGGSSTLSTITVTFLVTSAPEKPLMKVRTCSW